MRRSDLNIFLDRSVQVPSPDLWRGILDNLEGSASLILLCSPVSAASGGVEREVQHWLGLGRGLDSILVVLLAGSLDECLPTPLRAERSTNGYDPYFVDLRWVKHPDELDIKKSVRFQEDVATLAAVLRGVAKEELVSDELAIRERSLRIQRRFIVGLSTALVLSMVLGLAALFQWRSARTESNIAEARALAAQSRSLLSTRLDVAQLLAVLAYRRDPSPQTESALFAAVTAGPKLVRYMNADSTVMMLGSARDGRSVMAGTQSGRLYRWPVTGFGGESITMFSGPVTSLAASADGSTIAATDGHAVAIWRPGHGFSRLNIPDLAQVTAVGLSPSGRLLTITTDPPAPTSDPSTLLVVDPVTGTVTHTTSLDLSLASSTLIMNDENHVIACDGDGVWQRIDLTSMTSVPPENNSGIAGIHNYANTFSDDGSFFSATNADVTIPVVSTESATPDLDRPNLLVDAPGHDPDAIALSPGAQLLAVADSGVITVERTRSPAAAPGRDSETLQGIGTVNQDGLRFLGSGRFLAAASGNSVVLWDRQQSSRIGANTQVYVPTACDSCDGPTMSLSGDGRKVAILDGNTEPTAVTVVSIPGSGGTAETSEYLDVPPLSNILNGSSFGPLTWSSDSRSLFVGTQGTATAEFRRGGPAGAVVGTASMAGADSQTVLNAVPGASTQVRLTTPDSSVFRGARLLDNASRVLNEALHPPVEQLLPSNSQEADSLPQFWALSPDSSRIAAIVDSNVWLVAMSDASVRTIALGDADHVAFTRGNLLVSRGDGSLEVRDPVSGALVRTVPGDQPDTDGLAAAPDGDLAVRLRADGTMKLVDVNDGLVLGPLGDPGEIDYGSYPGLMFGPGGTKLLAVHPYSTYKPGSGKLDEFDLSPETWAQVACRSAGRNLTLPEWRQLVGDVDPGDLDCH
jgi:hypothetical protein